MNYKLSEIALINPKESLPSGTLAKKVAMEKLQPFCRDIDGFELTKYNGGTKFRNGDTIMARITPCLENGKIAKVNILDEKEIGFGSTEYIIFRAKPGVTDEDYLYYLITSPIVRNSAIKSMVGSSGRQWVQTDVIQNLEIDVPELPIQKKIGSILKRIDDKIELNRKINDNLANQVQAIYTEWFMNLQTDDSRVVSLSELMDYAGGSQPPASEFVSQYKDGYVRFVQIRDYETDNHITYIPISNKNKLCEEHDIMIARYGASLGRICFGINGAYNVALAKVFPKKDSYREYLRCYLTSREFYEGINSRGGRSAQAGFNQGDIDSFKILFPIDEKKIIDFEYFASKIFDKRLSIIKENKNLAALRDSLLPKLMSGEIDVDLIEL